MSTPPVRFPWYGSAGDLATDITYELSRADTIKLVSELVRLLATKPEKFVKENLAIQEKEKKQ